MLKPLFSLRTMVWPLAAPLRVLDQTVPNVAFDLTVGTRGIPEGKVVHPSFQVPIQLSNQDRDRLMALMTVGHLTQLLPFPLDRLFRREHVQVFSIASFQITVIPERMSRPGEFHPEPLAEPSVKLSPHSAPIRQTRRPYRFANGRRDPTVPYRAVQRT